MFRFAKEQKIFDVGGVRVGGQAGELPTVMVGSIFYHRHKIVKDEEKGLFDKVAAELVLRREEEASANTGNPRIIDVVGANPDAIVKYIDFVAEATTSPFLMDGTTAEVRIAAAKHVEEVGLTERAVYNTIGVDATPDEIEAIRDFGIRSAVVLAFNPRRPMIEGRIEILKGSKERKGLLKVAQESGVDNVFVDTSVLDVPDIGLAAKTVYLVKEELGLPAGCAPANAMDTWRRAKSLDPKVFLASNASAHVGPVIMGADFILYGPIHRAPHIYPAVAVADAIVAYCMRRQFRIRPLTKEHPLFKIF